ncbi:hypothetical protein N7530_013048 [Penicillium desertorum]|uniref:Uncharacterized protein n=1 Tax=Penicillium desertorum TaxID=1303715 RepID=A0A9W9WD35_9EURO|nr:hypothetical protein N7530_013048 [Penicillium desertorum]
MTMPYLLPRRGGLFTDPPPPGGGGWLYSAFYRRPRLPTCLERLPLDPRSGAPGQAVERTGESPKVTISSPRSPRGGGSPPAILAEGACFTLSPPQTPRPPDGPEGLPLRPPRFDPRPSRRANWPIPKGTISLPRARGLANDPPAGGTWLSSAYHPKPRRQIDRDGATPAKEGATLLGENKGPGPHCSPHHLPQEIPPCPLSQLA